MSLTRTISLAGEITIASTNIIFVCGHVKELVKCEYGYCSGQYMRFMLGTPYFVLLRSPHNGTKW